MRRFFISWRVKSLKTNYLGEYTKKLVHEDIFENYLTNLPYNEVKIP